MKPVFVIAEAGVNHNGSEELALQLVDTAAACGADAVKFQTFHADQLVAKGTATAAYQQQATGSVDQHAMLRALELSDAAHGRIAARCAERGIEFMSTPFDSAAVELLLGLGMRHIKIPSGEITNLPFLRYVARPGLPVIMSTGMANLGDIEAAIGVLEHAGLRREQITLLHCNTEYPTPMQDVNLLAMANLGRAFGVAVGYSDHTQGIEVAIAAVALGATVIEKHFTLDRSLPGPDHQASLEPAELRAMVAAIRNIEVALGDGIKRPSASEHKNRLIARKSLVAARPIHAGELFSADNLAAKRPGSGVSPMRWDEIIGRPAPRNFAADELITP